MTMTRMLLLRFVSTFHVFDSVDDEELLSLRGWALILAIKARSCFFNVVLNKNRPKLAKKRVEASFTPKQSRFSLGTLKILFLTERPHQERQNALRIRIALSMSLSAQHVPDGSWPRLHAWRVPTHEPTTVSTSPGSLCLPQSSAWQLLAIFSHHIFLDVDVLERFLRHFEVLRFLWVHSQQRFPHQRVDLLFYELVLCWRFEHFLNHRQQIVVAAIWKTMTKQQIVTPLHLDTLLEINAQHSHKHFEICCGAHVLLVNFNSGMCAPVATNRILSLLSPLVVTNASEGGRGRQGMTTLMPMKRHGKQNVGGMCSWNSKMSFPPSRNNGKLRSLNTWEPIRHENEGCHLQSRISDHSTTKQQAGQETPMVPYIRKQPFTMKILRPSLSN